MHGQHTRNASSVIRTLRFTENGRCLFIALCHTILFSCLYYSPCFHSPSLSLSFLSFFPPRKSKCRCTHFYRCSTPDISSEDSENKTLRFSSLCVHPLSRLCTASQKNSSSLLLYSRLFSFPPICTASFRILLTTELFSPSPSFSPTPVLLFPSRPFLSLSLSNSLSPCPFVAGEATPAAKLFVCRTTSHAAVLLFHCRRGRWFFVVCFRRLTSFSCVYLFPAVLRYCTHPIRKQTTFSVSHRPSLPPPLFFFLYVRVYVRVSFPSFAHFQRKTKNVSKPTPPPTKKKENEKACGGVTRLCAYSQQKCESTLPVR